MVELQLLQYLEFHVDMYLKKVVIIANVYFH